VQGWSKMQASHPQRWCRQKGLAARVYAKEVGHREACPEFADKKIVTSFWLMYLSIFNLSATVLTAGSLIISGHFYLAETGHYYLGLTNFLLFWQWLARMREICVLA
jgi:hypothetical protein